MAWRAPDRRRARRTLAGEELLFELSELARWLDAELRAESPPQIAVSAQRLRSATRSVERDHQEFCDGFFEWLLGDHDFEVADHVSRAALCDARLGQRSPRQEMSPFETSGLDLDEDLRRGLRTDDHDGDAALARSTPGTHRIRRQGLTRKVDEAIELVRVDVVGSTLST